MKKILGVPMTLVIAGTSLSTIAFAGNSKPQTRDYTQNFFWLQDSKAHKVVDLPEKRDEVMYQIFPSSFADGDGDGKGDLIGVKNKIDYLKNLGINSVWFNPIFESPSNHRYDVKDDKKIDQELGGQKAFDEMMKEFKKNNIKVYLDFVPNHSSDQSALFQQWLKDVKDVKIKKDVNDYYLAASVDFPVEYDSAGKQIGFKNTTNNYFWNHIPGTSKEKSKLLPGQRNAYFSAFTTGSMPDRNFASKATTKYLVDVAKYWLDKGVDGFRVDAVPHLFDYRNVSGEQMNEYWEYGTRSKGDSVYLGSTWFKYFVNTLKEHKKDVYVFGETLRSANEISEYSSSMAQFNDPLYTEAFKLRYGKNTPGNIDLANIYNINENKYKAKNPNHKGEISFLSSHDKNRLSSIMQKASDSWNDQTYKNNLINYYIASFGIQLTLPDQPLIYYGDEIGLYGYRENQDRNDVQRRLVLPWQKESIKYTGDDNKTIPYLGNTKFKTLESTSNQDTMSSLKTKKIYKNVSNFIKFRNDNSNIWKLPFYQYNLKTRLSDLPAYLYVDNANKVNYVFVTNATRQDRTIDFRGHNQVMSVKYLNENKEVSGTQTPLLKIGQTIMLKMKHK